MAAKRLADKLDRSEIEFVDPQDDILDMTGPGDISRPARTPTVAACI